MSSWTIPANSKIAGRAFSDRLFKAVLRGRAHALAVGNEAVGINDRFALFALAHMAAGFERLAEGEPSFVCMQAIRGSAH
jgi:hypothetical protein